MQRKMRMACSFMIFSIMLLSSRPFQAISLNHITILKISAQDQSAVIQTPGSKPRIIKPGDKIGENGLALEISAGRIVIEEDTAQGKELVIIYFENGKQRLERISKGTVFSQTLYLYVPQTVVEQ